MQVCDGIGEVLAGVLAMTGAKQEPGNPDGLRLPLDGGYLDIRTWTVDAWARLDPEKKAAYEGIYSLSEQGGLVYVIRAVPSPVDRN